MVIEAIILDSRQSITTHANGVDTQDRPETTAESERTAMKKLWIGIVAVLGVAVVSTGSEAATGLKVISVTARNVRFLGTSGNTWTVVNVHFSGDVGTGCLFNNVGQAYMDSAGTVLQPLLAQNMEAVRQVALSALLGGRLVDVTPVGGCTTDGAHQISTLTIK